MSPVQSDGPYLVTVRPSERAAAGMRAERTDLHRGGDRPELEARRAAIELELAGTRRAFVSLDRAQRYCRRELADRGVWETTEVDALPAEGGTVLLPDGVIEVKRIRRYDLWVAAGRPKTEPGYETMVPALCAAYNAAEHSA